MKYGENPTGGAPVTLAGAVMGLFAADDTKMTAETALLTTTTAADGSFAFENIPYGHWVVAEITAPPLYTISPEQHHIYIGPCEQVYEIRVDDTLIRGGVQLIKTEAVDEPGAVKQDDDNHFLRRLEGAVFELYRDVNGDKKLDSGDTLIGTLKETNPGFHEMYGLTATGYFVKEKTAPAGYKPDTKAYYFAITEDGQTYVVENAGAGKGFTNEAYRGNLKIVKDSSDGRKDGFAFEVKKGDGSYCETFVSDKTGVIEVKGLRVGKYTVTEIANRASTGYIIPDAATVEIKKDATSTVQLFNEKPKTPEPTKPGTPTPTPTPATPTKPVPQTGDDNAQLLWIILLSASVLGAGGCVFHYFYGKRKNILSAKHSVVILALGIAMIALTVGSGVMLSLELGQYERSAQTYAELTEYITVETAAPAEDGGENNAQIEDAPEVDPGAPSVLLPDVDFAALREKGPGVTAWLTLEGTVINYPVAQGQDNSYYLKHLYDGTANKVGCLFVDYENAPGFADRNNIIYGHNMRDGSMFASLLSYQEQAYYDEHPTMLLVTPDGGYVAELFTTFVASPSEAPGVSPWTLKWKDDGAYTTWLNALRERSLFQSEVSVTSSDKVLTLSTCTHSGKDRFIVMGMLA